MPHGTLLLTIESITVAFFALDYLLRLLTARHLHPKISERRALLKYVFSVGGLIDMLSFLPYYLPIFFPAGALRCSCDRPAVLKPFSSDGGSLKTSYTQ